MFPWYLRAAGYYVTNNVKTDYNFSDDPWHESSETASWRSRKDGQPFFHVRNYMTTHEQNLHFPVADVANVPTQTDPRSVRLDPHHPDTPLFRYSYARFHDRLRMLDREMGELLGQLEADGLRENTIIFYFGDNGGVLPGSKGYLRETGLHVPLVVWFPEKWKHLAPAPRGTAIDGVISFVDFAPTVLHLCGVDVPAAMDGRPFLGPGVKMEELSQRSEAIGYADRFDEKYDLSRSLRSGSFKYIRNYQPFLPEALWNNFRNRMPAMPEWRELHRAGRLNPTQARFFKQKAPEELYDLDADPYETTNLAGDPAHAHTLIRLRTRLRERLAHWPDLGFIPEPVFLAEGRLDPVRYGQAQRDRIGRLIEIADLPLEGSAQALPRLEGILNDGGSWERYWALIAATSLGTQSAPLVPAVRGLVAETPDVLLIARSAEFLAIVAGDDPRPHLARSLQMAASPLEATLILNTVVTLADHHLQPGLKFEVPVFPAAWGADDLLARRIRYLQER
jgi:hypothetical protein